MTVSLDKQAMWDQLPRFIKPAQLLESTAEVDPALAVPAQWLAILEDQQHGRRQRLAACWSAFTAQAPGVAAFLNTQARRVLVLAEQDRALSLLYPFTAGGELYFYRGHPPLSVAPEKFQSVWPRIPREFREFYTTIHDGWTFLSGNSMGPLPVGDWAYLSDDKFDIDEDSAARMPADISKVLTVFHNGGGDYLCLDFSAPDGTATGLIWWHEEPETPEVVDFWAYLDAWISIFFEDADKV